MLLLHIRSTVRNGSFILPGGVLCRNSVNIKSDNLICLGKSTVRRNLHRYLIIASSKATVFVFNNSLVCKTNRNEALEVEIQTDMKENSRYYCI